MALQEQYPASQHPSILDPNLGGINVSPNTFLWEDFVRRHNPVTAPVTERDKKAEASPVKLPRHEKTHTFGKWREARWIVASRKRRKEKLEQDAREGKTGVQTFLTMARLSIGLAVGTEPNSKIRPAKRRVLQEKWRRWQQDLLGVIRR